MNIVILDKITGKFVTGYKSKSLTVKKGYSDLTKYQYEEIPSDHKPEDYSLVEGVLTHSPTSTPPEVIVKNSIESAILFGHSLIVDFATENVLMGITQAGKTKEVADYLANVTRYVQTGSLYEVMGEIDRLIADGVPVGLSPFITEGRLINFKSKVVTYLGG